MAETKKIVLEGEVKKTDVEGSVTSAADVEALKAQVGTLTKENVELVAKVDTLTLSNENLVAKQELDANDLDEATQIIDELKAKIAGYEAAPQTDGSGRKIHGLKGTKKKYQLVFETTLKGKLVNDDAIVADNSLLAELVKLESGAIREVGE